MPESRPPTGERIADEIQREMEDRLFRLKHVVVPPAEYYVYLHTDDYRQIEGLIARIVVDVQMTLNARVDELNRQSMIARLIHGARPPIETPAAGWTIHIAPAVNDDVDVGTLGIESRLCIPAPPGFGSGSATTRIFHSTVHRDGTRREGQTESVEAPAPPRSVVNSQTVVAARLAYEDNGQPHEVTLDREVVRVGRGGVSHPVEVRLVANRRVSREHCQIRRDAYGRYFVRNLSAWGTTVNGRTVPQNAEQELTEGATICLADTVILTFTAVETR